MPLSIAEFVTRWKIYPQTESAGSQSHFNDLCEMLGEKKPAESDSAGERYAFEKRVGKARGGEGFADVWMLDHFAWEYKGAKKDLKKAFLQLDDYRSELGNPPLLVVSDFDRFEVHTNFTSTKKRVYSFNLDDLNRNEITASCPLPPLTVLRALFGDTDVLRPERTDAYVTQEAAKKFSRLAERLELENRNLGASRAEVAHFLMRLLFCLFADSIGLLQDRLFRRLLQSEDRFRPIKFLRKLKLLFEAMSQRDSIFGEHSIKYFNGGLFDSAAVIELDVADLAILYEASKNYDWSRVAPAIFGTLFERSLDKERRSLIGAHYTSEEDILLLVEPVVMKPLNERWEQVKQKVLEARITERAEDAQRSSRQARLRVDLQSEKLLNAWIEELTAVRVLDPACGSGNFLYVALRRLLDLWLEARNLAAAEGIALGVTKMVSPRQLYGIETEFYAHELASIVVWIGFLQWKHEHGVIDDREPVLEVLANIEHGDAILRYDAVGKAYEPEWPEAEFIIGNPPFLGGKLLRRRLGDKYVDDLFGLYSGAVRAESDLVVYWFERARQRVSKRLHTRVALLATQGIRGGANRSVLRRITETAPIFWAWSDRKWLLAGAAVHVSMVGFGDPFDFPVELDGQQVETINPDLTSGSNLTSALRLDENRGICFMGTTKVGAFDISPDVARRFLDVPVNPNGRPNSDVVRPWINARDFTTRSRGYFVIDFGTEMSQREAAFYELPFEYVRRYVYPTRMENKRESYRAKWWIHGEPRPELRAALIGLSRFIISPGVSKHRIFAWSDSVAIPDHALFAFARDDDYIFGVLQSRVHEQWALRQGTQLEDRPRYTPTPRLTHFRFLGHLVLSQRKKRMTGCRRLRRRLESWCGCGMHG